MIYTFYYIISFLIIASICKADEDNVKILGETTICEDKETVLTAFPQSQNYHYLWSTGETSPSIVIKNPGMIVLTIRDNNGFNGSDTVIVNVLPSPDAEIIPLGPTTICDGDSVILASSFNTVVEFSWSTMERTPEIVVSSPGTYYLYAYNSYGCFDTASVNITVKPAPKVKILSETNYILCPGDTITLYTEKEYRYQYWSTGETTRKIKITKPGNYTVFVVDSNGCAGGKSININSHSIEINEYDFDNINMGFIAVSKYSQNQFDIKNLGSELIKIYSIYVKSGNDIFKVYTDYNFPADLDVREFKTFDIRFSPKQPILYQDSLIIEISEPCYKRYSFKLVGEGRAIVQIWIPETNGYTNQSNFHIPLKARLLSDSNDVITVSYRAEIRYDASAFLPDNVQQANLVQNYIENGDRVLVVEDYNKNISSKTITLADIVGTVLLGDEEFTTIYI